MLTSDTVVVRALYDAAAFRDALAQAEADSGTTEAAERHRLQAEEYREYALTIERVLIGMADGD